MMANYQGDSYYNPNKYLTKHYDHLMIQSFQHKLQFMIKLMLIRTITSSMIKIISSKSE